VSKNLFASLQAELDQRAADGLSRRRRLLDSAQDAHIKADGREVLSFCSNDYLGLANHPQLIAALQEAAAKSGVGSGASHLITGHHRYHHELEQALAAFVGLPAALLFSTGYMANLGVITALMGRSDAIFADKLNHASLNDAAVLSRAELNRYPHNDLAALEKMLRASQASRKLVVADAVFSMDGDIAPVPELLALCEQYDAWLMLDDAHGFGVLGEKGRGVLSHFQVASPRIIYMATLGKAAGVSGAFVAGEPVLINYLIQNARTYIYTTATPPALSATLLAALKIIEQEDSRRAHLNQLINLLKSNLRLQRWQLMDSSTAIQPVVVGSNEDVLRLSEYLLTQGILVPAIRPPTVPKGSARLRISLSAAHSVDDIQRLITAMQSAEKVMAI
jgi:8-amino-7-oxononanoate synthase